MKKKVLTLIKFLLFLLLASLLLYFAFKGINFSEFSHQFKKANYFWVGLAVIASFIALLSRAYRWSLLIEPLGKRPSLRDTYDALMVGYLANFAFPRIGEVTRCAMLNRTNRIPVDSLIGTVIVERAIDFFCMIILLLIVIIGQFDLYGGFLNQYIIDPISKKLLVGSTAYIIISLFIVLFIALAVWLYNLRHHLEHHKYLSKVYNLTKGIFRGLKTVGQMKNRWAFLLHTLIIWLMYWLMAYVIVFSIPATSHLSPMDGLFLLVIGSLGMTVPTQGGFGSYHIITALGLTLFGLTREEGLVYAVISHETQFLMIILLGSLSLASIFYKKKKNYVD